jgi:hypothetical protein
MSSIARPFGLAFSSLLALALTARAAGPADGLFALVPPDAAATLAIEDLRGHAREVLASPLAEEVRRMPGFRAWLASDKFSRFDQARLRIEDLLGTKLATIRDELLGDAVVLTLRVPPRGRPEEARGLLLVRVRNRPLLERLIHEINSAQTRSGELARVTRSTRLGVSYWSREFRPPAQRPAEYITVLDDHTFAWSNAEELVQGVIDRRAGKARALADEPKFQRVRRRLPEPAAVSLFLEPSFLAQLLRAAARPPKKPARDRGAELLGRYLGAQEYFGGALQWHDGLVLHTEELVDPGKLDPWVRRWAARPGAIAPSLRRAPATALAMASGHLDFNAVLAAFRQLVPDREQTRVDNLVLALNGILLGHDLESEILPQLGPGVLAYLEAPAAAEVRLEKVLVVGLGNASGLTAALENALRTYLAVSALDQPQGNPVLQLESRDVAGRKVTALRPNTPLAFAIDGNRLILGSSADAVARALSTQVEIGGGGGANEFERLHAAHFPQAGSFVCVDTVRLRDYLLSRRPALVARLAARQHGNAGDAERDFDQALALMALFRQAYLTTTIDPDATAVHRTVGLIAKDATPALAPPEPEP